MTDQELDRMLRRALLGLPVEMTATARGRF